LSETPATADGRPVRLAPLDLALFLGTVLAWGFSWIAMRHQATAVSPEVSAAARFAIAAPIMAGIAMARGERLRWPLRTHVVLAVLGATLFSTNLVLFYHASLYIASGLLSVVFSLASVVNVALAVAVLRVRAEGPVLLGGLCGAAGVALMFYPEAAALGVGRSALIGLAFCGIGTLSFCIGNLISMRLQKRGVPVFAVSAWGMAYGALLLAAVAAVRGDSFALEMSVAYIGGLLYLAVIATAVAFALYLTLLGRIGPSRAGYVTVLMPLVALAVSTAVESYVWTWSAALGLVAVLVGNVLVLRAPRSL
jgi:drug/metabolite transporter (DMT)-like permease